jgi:hypothetical protein
MNAPPETLDGRRVLEYVLFDDGVRKTRVSKRWLTIGSFGSRELIRGHFRPVRLLANGENPNIDLTPHGKICEDSK